ncbi:MAG: hypothetical protein F4Z35_08445 [Dehalococcoidia bacterium]|nr:hypothetical protein [Dehalococcoidia bacterium]
MPNTGKFVIAVATVVVLSALAAISFFEDSQFVEQVSAAPVVPCNEKGGPTAIWSMHRALTPAAPATLN